MSTSRSIVRTLFLTSDSGTPNTPALRHKGTKYTGTIVLTLFEIVVKTDTDFTVSMSGNRQPSLGLDALFPQIDVFLGTRVDNFDVRPLVGTRTDVCCDNYQRVIVCGIPETFLLWPPIGGEIELYSIRRKDAREEEEEEREPEETRHGECGERPIAIMHAGHKRVNPNDKSTII